MTTLALLASSVVVAGAVAPPASADHSTARLTGTVTIMRITDQSSTSTSVHQEEVAEYTVDGEPILLGDGRFEIPAVLEFSFDNHRTASTTSAGLTCTSEWRYAYGPAVWTGRDVSGQYAHPVVRVDLNDEIFPGRARVTARYGTTGPVEGTWWDRRHTPNGTGGYYCAETVQDVSFSAVAVPTRELENLAPATPNSTFDAFALTGQVLQQPSADLQYVTTYDLTLYLPDHDTDGDGLGDRHETEIGTLPENPDSDGDDLDDGDEVAAGSSPHRPDSDGDGFPDGVEAEAGTSPTDPEDFPDGGGGGGGGAYACETEGTVARTAEYLYRAVVPSLGPDIHLFTFEPRISYCFDGEESLVRSAWVFGTVDDGADTAILELLGFEASYVPRAENVFFAGSSARISGEFAISFDFMSLLDRTGVRGLVEGKIKKVVAKRLEKHLARYGYTALLDKEVLKQAQYVSKRVVEASQQTAELLGDLGMPSAIAQWVEDKVVELMIAKTREFKQTVGAFSYATAYRDYTADQLASLLVAELLALVDLEVGFPVWQPTVEYMVEPSGDVVPAVDGFLNGFMEIRTDS